MMNTPSCNRQRNSKRMLSWEDPFLSSSWYPNIVCDFAENPKNLTLATNASYEASEASIEACLMPEKLLSDPMQDSEMLCLFENAMNQDYDLYHDGQMSEEGERGHQDCRDDREETAIGGNSFCELERCIETDTSHIYKCVDQEAAPSTGLSLRNPFPVKADWSIEMCFEQEHTATFKLHCADGACLVLLPGEVVASIQAILEDATDNLVFRVHTLVTGNIEVDSDGILSLLDSVLARYCLAPLKCAPVSRSDSVAPLYLFTSRCTEADSPQPKKRQKKSRTPLSPWQNRFGSKIRRHQPIAVVE